MRNATIAKYVPTEEYFAPFLATDEYYVVFEMCLHTCIAFYFFGTS
jgi:hypothetical protein